MAEKRLMDKENDSNRSVQFIIIVAILFFILILRLFVLQVINGEYYREKAVKNSLKEKVVKASRGKIYDVNGNILADNVTGYKIIHTDTKPMSSKEKEILLEMYDNNKINYNKLTEKVKLKLDEIFFDVSYIAKISNNSFKDILNTFYNAPILNVDKEILVVEDFDVNIALREVERLPNDRIDIVEYNKRSYPNKNLASHVLGYVKVIDSNEYKKLKDSGYLIDDLIGKKGIEKNYDKILKGSNGKEFVEVDVKGNLVKKLDEIGAVGGENIYLSIDKELQEYMTNKLSGLAASFIAIDVKTGKIITFVSSPEIDSNLLSSKISKDIWDKLVNSKATPLLNKGIQGLYPPGSTFKVVSGASILESGISPNASIYSSGIFTYGKVSFKDSHLSGHGYTNFYKSIEESVNTYYYENILKISRDKFFEVAHDFGVGERTGIDILGEQEGLLPTPEWKKNKFKTRQSQVWLPGDLINMSIGQGYLLLTPMQVLMIYQAIANDGVMMTPTLVDRFSDTNGNIRNNEAKINKKLNISEKTLKDIKTALKLPVSGANGTAKILKFDYVKVAAKTGTAQNSSDKNHSWIAGYFPADKPEIAFVVLVERGGYGGVAAGSQARAFIEKYYKKGEK